MSVFQVTSILLAMSAVQIMALQDCVTHKELDERLSAMEQLVHSERLVSENTNLILVQRNKDMETELMEVKARTKHLEAMLVHLLENGRYHEGVRDNGDMDMTADDRFASTNVQKRYAAVIDQQAFTAIIDSTSTQPLASGQIVRFDRLVSNLGNAFDIHRNIFLAKADGWYVFSISVLSKPDETLRLDVVRDGVEAFHVYATGNEYNAASKTAVLHLTAGNQVWVRSSPLFDNNVHGYGHTSFTGFLLYST